jgi:hypothetical protein
MGALRDARPAPRIIERLCYSVKLKGPSAGASGRPIGIVANAAGRGERVGGSVQVIVLGRSKVGLDVALEAPRETWRERRASMDELWHDAQVCGVARVMRPYLESLDTLT